MSAAIEDLVLRFVYDDESGDKQFYIPGDLLRGNIDLYLRRNLRMRSLTLLILGGASVSWEEPGRKKKLYTAREEYLQGTKVLMDADVDDTIELSRGVHQFSFQYQLPSNLPSSFSGVYGSVTYVAKVVVDVEDKGSATITSEPFLVLRRPPLAPSTFADQEKKTSKLFFGFMNAGQVRMQCQISRSAAIPGEIIYVNGEVANWSTRGITLLQGAILLQSTYRAQGGKHKTIIFSQTLNKRIDVFDVPLLKGRRWRNVQISVPPFLPDSGLEGCSIMDVKYFFEFRAQIEDRDDIYLQFPLFVGGHPVGYDGGGRIGGGGGGLRSGSHSLDFDAFTLSRGELPWYGGGGVLTESVDGDVFEIK